MSPEIPQAKLIQLAISGLEEERRALWASLRRPSLEGFAISGLEEERREL